MSDVQHGPDWWQASDGKWYPPQTPPGPVAAPQFAPPGAAGPVTSPPVATSPPAFPPAPTAPPYAAPGFSSPPSSPPGYVAGGGPIPPPPGGAAASSPRSVSTGLGGTIQGFSWALGGLALIAAALALASLLVFDTWWDAAINSQAELDAYDDWVSVDESFGAFAGLAMICWLVLVILLMIWMNSAHKTTQQLWRGDRQWSSGWTVGAWFIPVANMIMPKLVLSEVERIADAPRSNGIVPDASWKERSTSLIGKLWWISFTVGTALVWVGSVIGNDVGASDGEIRAKYVCNAVGFAVMAMSGVFGALHIRQLGKRLSADGLRQPL